MNDNQRIERLIREARVQRSAAIGEAIGNFLADTWLATARVARKATAALRNPKARHGRPSKAIYAR